MSWTAPRTWTTAEVVTATMLNEQIKDNLAHLKTPDAWTPLTLTGAWVNKGGAYAPAAYYKDPQGVVHLRGCVEGGAISTIIGTLPTGYRPLFTVQQQPILDGSLYWLIVATSGDIIANISGVTLWVTLDGISFRTD